MWIILMINVVYCLEIVGYHCHHSAIHCSQILHKTLFDVLFECFALKSRMVVTCDVTMITLYLQIYIYMSTTVWTCTNKLYMQYHTWDFSAFYRTSTYVKRYRKATDNFTNCSGISMIFIFTILWFISSILWRM